MMKSSAEFIPTIGLELHVQLQTESKAFCADSAAFGEAPNTQVSPISLAHPGTLPFHNMKAIEFATKLGLALNCDITKVNQYARKNYFYADLPKGYQITQDKTPICRNGYLDIDLKDGKSKRIRLTRIHMEEDSGKSMHDQDLYDTLLDYNRAGVPLVEIVTEPDIDSSEEAYIFLSEIRKLVRYLEICDGNMEEGSLRCDANISVRLKDNKDFGIKVEVKNMNSMTNVKRAIEFEIKRQIDAINKGEEIVSETRSFNALNGTTFSMRSKEEGQDYRYFPEPDLPPFIVSEHFLNDIRSKLPELPKALENRLISEFGLPPSDASILVEDKALSRYYLEIVNHTSNFKAASNWLLGTVKSWLNNNGKEIVEFPVSPFVIANIIKLVDEGIVSNTAASGPLFNALINQPHVNPAELAEKLEIIQTSDDSLLNEWVEDVLKALPDKVLEYKNGKKGLMGLFVGEVMKKSKGKADPQKVNKILLSKLDSN
jgi:aspartyl-tRNA(Asn)/glutamyl-tRNA(Gln) amidotransferase subunit B